MDGTLADTEVLKARSLVAAAADFGAAIAPDVYKEVMGSAWSVVRAHIFTVSGIAPEISAFDGAFREHYAAFLAKGAEVRTFLREGIVTFRARGGRTALVTSAPRWMVDGVFVQNDLISLFDAIVTAEDVKRHKPDPEAYLIALERLGAVASRSVVIEDSAAGVRAGRAAGCDVIAIRHEFNATHDFSTALCVCPASGVASPSR